MDVIPGETESTVKANLNDSNIYGFIPKMFRDGIPFLIERNEEWSFKYGILIGYSLFYSIEAYFFSATLVLAI